MTADRYQRDQTRPTRTQARQDLVHRTLLPALAVWLVIVGIGFLIRYPLEDLPAEGEVNEALVDVRNPELNLVTQVLTNIGGTHFIVIACAAAMALIFWRTRQWWFAVVPGIAVSVQSAVFVTSSALIGRERPDVEHLDDSPPTSAFPSGHTGASTAFYLTLALLAQRIRNPALRWAATILCFLVPALVAFSRLYRGMHHPADVVVGAVNGVICCWLAWRWLRRGTGARAEAPPAEGARATA